MELGLGNSTNEGGRKGMKLAFNAKSAFGIGVDIRESGILLMITDLDGNVTYEKKTTPTNKVAYVIEYIQTFIQECGINEDLLIGLSVAVPSVVENTKDIVVDAPSLGWFNLNLKKELAAYFSIPIYINNDVDCSALGERWLGNGAQTDNMFYMSIDAGIGGSIIANGQLIQGSHYSAGEVGYFIDKEDTVHFEPPIAGQYGPFERKLIPLIKEFQETGIPSKALTLNLSIAITNLVNLLNPEKIIIGGVEGPSLAPIVETLEQNVRRFSPIQSKIEIACLGERAQALGALWYLFDRIVFSPL
jgi:predicted NBD/HSP70 family sugar kinase